ncbi:unnamed protein product [Adineta steineri]|uniref:Uncharacterized protein n=1 Tax=Adineta steineri TaxID=433720 RepID=A0A819C4M8_9BILA|nr:unnamed protein product [Adineta steineri]CAF3801797.1 unnamed protein product [Adineta steineri]
MSKLDNNHRYHPYSRAKNYNNNDRRYDDDNYKRSYKKNNKHHYHYHDNRNYNDFSYRRSYRNDYRYQPPKSNMKSKSYSYFSTPPPPLMSTEIPPLLPPILSPSLPPPPPPLLTAIPHERESWIRSVKKTKTNESTEQKTQYLETMLRMPQQKSLLNSTRFDRMRFADNQLSTATTTTTTTTTTNSVHNDSFDANSFHLIGDIKNYDDIRTLEEILFNDEFVQQQLQNTPETCSNHELLPTSLPEVTECESIREEHSESKPCSGFLIDGCDEEEAPPLSPPPRPPLLRPSSEELTQLNDEDITEQRVMLVSELDAADAERKEELKRQKRLHQKLQKKPKEKKQSKTKIENEQAMTTSTNDKQESLSDWIIEYDTNSGTDQVLQLTNEVRRTSIAMNDEDKTAKVNMILMKIKKQQQELNKLRQYVMSMLGEQEKSKSSKINRQNSNLTHDLLLAFLNQSNKSGCWLCSGKMYAEIATQCDHDNEQ